MQDWLKFVFKMFSYCASIYLAIWLNRWPGWRLGLPIGLQCCQLQLKLVSVWARRHCHAKSVAAVIKSVVEPYWRGNSTFYTSHLEKVVANFVHCSWQSVVVWSIKSELRYISNTRGPNLGWNIIRYIRKSVVCSAVVKSVDWFCKYKLCLLI